MQQEPDQIYPLPMRHIEHGTCEGAMRNERNEPAFAEEEGKSEDGHRTHFFDSCYFLRGLPVIRSDQIKVKSLKTTQFSPCCSRHHEHCVYR